MTKITKYGWFVIIPLVNGRGLFMGQKKARKVKTIRGLLEITLGSPQYSQILRITARGSQYPAYTPSPLETPVMSPQIQQDLTGKIRCLHYIGLFNVQSEHALLKTSVL